MKEVSEKEFNEILKKSEAKPILIDFYADWCMPCQAIKPILEKIEKETEIIEIVKINVDRNKELVNLFGITSIPTLILIKDGKEIDRLIGLMPEAAIKKWIDENT